MHEYAKTIAEHIKECYKPSEMNREELTELGEWTDIMKDITEYDRNLRIIEAMDEYEDEESAYRMGYDNYRHANGRFARKGTGKRMGYRPYLHMTKWDDEDMYDDYPEIMNNYRMGYTPARRMMNDTEHSRYGESYDNYRMARKHYSETHDAENQRKMRDTIAEVFDDMEMITVDMVKDMTAEDKTKYKQKLQSIMQKIQ